LSLVQAIRKGIGRENKGNKEEGTDEETEHYPSNMKEKMTPFICN